jgi:small nuclear ribonucleoprotein (snRNP)-like protein
MVLGRGGQTSSGGSVRLFNRYPVLQQIIVNTRSDRTFRGVLWRKRRGYLVLRNAEMLRGKGETVPMDGEVVIPAANVDFIQVVG